jgi:poly(3-hydroxybutyrate) depolymerase
MSLYRLLALCVLLLTGCLRADGRGSGDDDDDASDDDDADDDDAGPDDDDAGGSPAPEYSRGDCPQLGDGNNSFATGSTSYDVIVELPADPEGAPVLFVWHWLGGTASQILEWVGFSSLADEGAIVIAPESSGSAYEWSSFGPGAGNADLLLFEDLLACAADQWNVDMDRIYSTGMSAGGLWTSYMTMWESEWLAATAPLSGGVNSAVYRQPDEPIPVLLTWGGAGDVYGTFSFDVANREFSADLLADGHFVAHCIHNEGHNPPTGSAGMVWRFFQDHPKGVSPDPWADGVPSGMPSYCGLP